MPGTSLVTPTSSPILVSTMDKPFFVKIVIADLLNFATDPEGEGMTVLQLAKELQRGKSGIPYIQGVIDEAINYHNKMAKAGKKGGKARAEKSQAKPKQSSSKAQAFTSKAQASNSNNNSNSTITENTKKRDVLRTSPKESELSFAVPTWLPDDLWKAYLDVRKKKKAANTDYALKLIIKKLERFRNMGHDPVDILEASVMAGWTGVFEPKLNGTVKRGDKTVEALRSWLGGGNG